MKKKQNEFFIDDNGERWKLVEIPCPQKLQSRKQTFKISFEVEFELELTESQKLHKHIVKEKENSIFERDFDKILNGDIEDIGKEHCSQMEAISKATANIKQVGIIKNLDNHIPRNYPFELKEFCRLNNWILQSEIVYLEKHIENELKTVFLKLLEESKAEHLRERKKALSFLLKQEEKRLRKRLKTKTKSPSFDEFKKFKNDCFEKIKILKQNHQTVTRKSLALKLYPRNLGSYEKKFRNELKKYSLDFDELKLECI